MSEINPKHYPSETKNDFPGMSQCHCMWYLIGMLDVSFFLIYWTVTEVFNARMRKKGKCRKSTLHMVLDLYGVCF